MEAIEETVKFDMEGVDVGHGQKVAQLKSDEDDQKYKFSSTNSNSKSESKKSDP